jgi:hypothetical protein
VAQQAWSEEVSNRVADKLSLARHRIHRSIRRILTEAEREFVNRPSGNSNDLQFDETQVVFIGSAPPRRDIVSTPIVLAGSEATSYRQRVARRLSRQLDEWADNVYDTCSVVLDEEHIAKTPQVIRTCIYDVLLPEIRRELKFYLNAIRHAEKCAGKFDLFWYDDDLLYIYRREREDVEQVAHDLIKRWREKGEEIRSSSVPAEPSPRSRLGDREKKIWKVIQRGSKGPQYCRELDNEKVSPRTRWKRDGCPSTYLAAFYHPDPTWRQRIQNEKSKVHRKALSLQAG